MAFKRLKGIPGPWALLGLGIGLGWFLVGLFLTLVPSEPSKEEIISRARGYGMVFREEVVPFDFKSSTSSSKDAPDNPGQLRNPSNSSQPLLEKQVTSYGVSSKEHEEVLVTIPPGATLEDIAALLEKQGVVSRALLEAEARKAGVTGKLKAGSYYLPRGDVAGILKRLTE
ncbi:aminodeoxychorismate lyase [Thermanaeromonas toyohensis ToBE]|uniref:Aminodeoxychorismate lyase n=1 Tax=Thermanaeromonas toyohensis ToBE TaxID=698762 RepID=A0A1W1VM23_9FIRM|nr:hypothetical protein [Thermanaeromonas toyohensis]SMB94101.1 aminodeoxychorismate lyase [Thermanaeromonas toyohensis ToBE]